MPGCELQSGDVALAAIPIRKMTVGIGQTLHYVAEERIALPKRTTGDSPELKPINVGAARTQDVRFHSCIETIRPALVDNDRRAHVLALTPGKYARR